MSAGARRALGVDYTVAVTGFAGPGGDNVGLVYVSVASENGVIVMENHFSGDREAVRLQTVEKALTRLAEAVQSRR
jgi:nicotinamide-nucleotide amidase